MRRRIAVVAVALSVVATAALIFVQEVRADEQETPPPNAPPEQSCPTCAAAQATRETDAPSRKFATLMEQADAVLLVKIAATDARAMPADGPMQVDAKVIRAVSGSPAAGSTIRFSASAWAGPNYEPGEQRIVFLTRLDDPALGQWASLEAGWIDLFFTNETVEVCSARALRGFLEQLGRQPPRPRLQFSVESMEHAPNVRVPDNDRACQDDGDCVIVSDHCGGCTCGTAVNRRWQAHYEDAIRRVCAGHQGPVCDRHCPQQAARCVTARCELGS